MNDCKQPRTFKEGPLTFTVRWVYDEDPDVSWLQQDYADVEPREEREKYKAQDAERLAAFNAGDWHMMGCVVDVSIETQTHWAKPHVIGRASLWGIESDSDASFIKETERELIDEARNDARVTKEAICKTLV